MVKSLLKQKLVSSFNASASSYDKNSQKQQELGERAIDLASASSFIGMPNPAGLEIGCGTGYLSKKLVMSLPTLDLLCIDIAKQMIEHANTLHSHRRITYRCADADDSARLFSLVSNWQVEKKSVFQKLDVVISFATFHWLLSLSDALKTVKSLLKTNGKLLFSIYLDGTYREMETMGLAKLRHNGMPKFHHILSVLANLGLKVVYAEEHFSKIHFKSLQDFRRYQRLQGTTRSSYLSFTEQKKIVSKLKHISENGTSFTVNTGLFMAEKIH